MTTSHLIHVSDHVYWMKPGLPDRPSLCVVVGKQHTLMLDAGASPAHTRLFLDSMIAEMIPIPRYVALTHWHWDHVFGLSALNIPIMAHQDTAAALAKLAVYDWDDAALDQRVASGEEIAPCADDIKLELPAPRTVQIVLPDIVFQDRLELQLGDVTCYIQHVGGDHAADACVMHIQPDGVLFLGDCLYDAVYAPVRHYTRKNVFPLLDTILGFDAQHFIEGHNDTVMTRAEIEAMAQKMRLAGTLVDQIGADEKAVMSAAQAKQPLDEDTEYFIRAFIAGYKMK